MLRYWQNGKELVRLEASTETVATANAWTSRRARPHREETSILQHLERFCGLCNQQLTNQRKVSVMEAPATTAE